MVCDSKENGGLGVLNLQTQNESLLLKRLHKFLTKLICHGCIWCGVVIIRMEDYQLIEEKAPFGGGISVN